MKITDWDKRNVEYNSSQELVVRQHLAILTATADLLDGTRYIVDSFSIRSGRTEDVFHYVMTAGSGDLDKPLSLPTITVYNEDFIAVARYAYSTILGRIPQCMTYSIVEDEILICCPGLNSVYGLLGGGLTKAALDTPTNENTASLTNFPIGVVISWAGRSVIADGGTLYFSDALNCRAYTGANFINPPGDFIYDMHVNAGGSLIIVTSNGVYALPESASYSGIGGVVLPVWTKLTDYQAIGYKSSVSYKGRVYGLTQRGVTLIDDKSSEETQISEKVGSRYYRGRVDFADYRLGTMVKNNDGLIILMGNFACFIDIGNKLISWYNTKKASFNSLMDIRGTLKDSDGTDIYMLRGYPVIKNGNNGEFIADATDSTPVFATVAGRIPHQPKSSPVVRHVTTMTDNTNMNMFVTVNEKTSSQVIPTDSLIIGAITVSDTTLVSEVKMRSREFNFNSRGDEIFLEIGVQDHPSKIPYELDIEFKGPGKDRPSL